MTTTDWMVLAVCVLPWLAGIAYTVALMVWTVREWRSMR